MDFITRLPQIHDKDCIFVVVDRLTKFSHFFAITTKFTIVQIAELFFEVFCLHGLPKIIISDRDNTFLNIFWEQLFRLTSTELNHNTSYHPQTNGQTENSE